ncbi:transcription elongation factor GreA [Calditrichota bacterium]
MAYEYFTEKGLEKAKEELHNLKYKKRPIVSQKVATAREHGDLKENAEYHAAREELSMIETKIQELQGRLARARIISEEEISTDRVHILTTVKLKDLKFNDTLEYSLVSASEADFKTNKISVESPIGKALIGKSVGDIVEVQAPAGIIKYEILDITR